MKKKLLLMLFVIGLAAGATEANMLLNPGFENGTFAAQNVPDNWTMSWSSYTSAWTWFDDADEAHWGDKYIKMVSFIVSGSSAWMWQEARNTPSAYGLNVQLKVRNLKFGGTSTG